MLESPPLLSLVVLTLFALTGWQLEWVKGRISRPFMRAAVVVFGLQLGRNVLPDDVLQGGSGLTYRYFGASIASGWT